MVIVIYSELDISTNTDCSDHIYAYGSDHTNADCSDHAALWAERLLARHGHKRGVPPINYGRNWTSLRPKRSWSTKSQKKNTNLR